MTVVCSFGNNSGLLTPSGFATAMLEAHNKERNDNDIFVAIFPFLSPFNIVKRVRNSEKRKEFTLKHKSNSNKQKFDIRDIDIFNGEIQSIQVASAK